MQTAEKRQNTPNDDDDKEDKYKDNEEEEQKEEGDNYDKEIEEDKANNKKQNMLSRVPDELKRFKKKNENYQNLTPKMMDMKNYSCNALQVKAH